MTTPQHAKRVSVDAAGIAPGTHRVVEYGRRKALLCNVAGEFFAVAERCSHAAFSLAEGRLDGPLIECPLHGAQFDVRDGSPVRRPASKPLTIHPVSREGSRAVIEFTSS